MKFWAMVFAALSCCCLMDPLWADDPPTPRQALQAFNDLIGTWRGTGTPYGSREEQQNGFWTETMTCEWQFQGKDAWIKIDFDKGRHFASATLRPAKEKDNFTLALRTVTKENQTFTGSMKNKVLTLERQAGEQTERLVFTFLHANRFLYRQEARPPNRVLFTKLYQVGATKEGVPFVTGDSKPECIVSGGLGTMAVSFQGQTYYVCCGGCRAEFNDNPEKYVKEFQEKKNKK
jgi:hypothetical protein